MAGWAILQRARAGQKNGIGYLALVDRGVCKTLWWTSDNIGIAIKYDSKPAADFAARRLRYNNAEVVPWAEAVKVIGQQNDEIIFHEAMSDAEMGWDGHKNAW